MASHDERSGSGDAPAAGASRALDEFRLTENVSHLLRRAHFRAEGLFSDEVGTRYGITPRQKAILVASYQQPGATLNQLADTIALDRQSTAEMVHRLVERGLLERRRSEQDGRAYAVSITRQGIDLLEAVMPHDRRVEERVLEPLPWEFRPLFAKCLRILIGLDQDAGGHRPPSA